MQQPRTINCAALFTLFAAMITCGITAAAPATLTQSVTYGSETITLRLTLQNLRGANFELWAQNAAGGYDVITPVSERSYIGTVDQYPDAVASGILQDNGQFKGAVYFDRGRTWFTLGSSVTSTRGLTQPSTYTVPSFTVTPGHGGTTTYGFDAGVDADYDYYSVRGASSIAKAFEMIEYSVAVTRAMYMQNTLLRPYLARVIIRTSQTQDPANGLTGGSYLDAVRNEWNTNHADADRDVVAGVTASDVGGGLAWVGVIGTSSAYSVSDSDSVGNFSVVWRHEMGHNWGMGHYDGGTPEGATVNSGNQFARMSGSEAELVLRHRDAKLAILANEAVYTAVNIPPYASIDAATFTHVVNAQTIVNVMANDLDANGDLLSIQSFDAVSNQGGSISQSGSGSGATLLYTPPASDYLGPDWFYYKIRDARGQTATGVATVNVTVDNPLRGYWPMDELSGTALDDRSVFDNTTTAINGAVVGGAGKFGNAVTLDGTNDHITAQNVTLNSNLATITAWINRNGAQNEWAGIIFNRSSDAAGLNFGTGNELRYHWNGTYWGWNSGLVPPENQWVFVAMVIEPTKATIYMHDGTLRSAVNTAVHSAESFGGTTYIGRDPQGEIRSFKGQVDDVRIYSRALTQSEILNLVAGGGAEYLRPFNGSSNVPTVVDLQWSRGANVLSQEVYVGTNYSNVLNATTTSPEHLASASGTATSYALSLTTGKTYYWRIDTVTPSGTIPGKVWSFTTGDLAVLNECDFENGFCDWVNVGGDTTDWTRLSGNTPSNSTGPSSGANGSTWYVYVEANNAGTAGNTIILEGPQLDASNYAMTLSFYYHMYGSNIGTLNIDVYHDGAWQNGVWSITGQQQTSSGAPYSEGTVDLSGYTGTIKVRFRGVAAGGTRGDMAIDDIRITGLALPNPPVFIGDIIVLSDGVEASSYADTLAGMASDPSGDTVTYSITSGPAWLRAADSGALSGIPRDPHTGLNEFTVRATDTNNEFAEAALQITVIDRFMGENGLADLTGMAANWLDSSCGICGGANLDPVEDVGLFDLSILAANWLAYSHPNLVAWYKFDDAAGTTAADSYGTLDGQINGAAWSSDATRGSVLSFDGIDDYVQISGYKGITGTTSRTCSAWIKTTSTQQSTILSWGTEQSSQRWTFRTESNGTLAVGIGGGYTRTAALAVNDGQWHHVAAVLQD
ncbi:MAG: M12 family metallo-peptidase, partial [Planctomycetales bacterium]|nr:M12 family metallo-peptidase [Planctomycetales bacterium]